MKTPTKFFLLLLAAIILGCVHTEYITPDYVLPPEPVREVLAEPEDMADVLEILAYYEFKVTEWEEWAKAVKTLIEANETPQD
jgi:hypothetical protein